MKQLFKERIAQATDIKCREMDRTLAGRLNRVIKEYDEDFGVAIGIKEGLRFILMNDKIVLDDTAGKRYAFTFDRATKRLDIKGDDDVYEMVLSYLAVCKNIDKTVIEIIEDIEKKLDIVSAIIDGASAEDKNGYQPAPVYAEKPEAVPPASAFGEEVKPAEPEPVDETPAFWQEQAANEDFEDVLNDVPDERPAEEFASPEPASEPAPEAAPSGSPEDEMARNVVARARNPFEAMRVLKSLGYAPDDFVKYGITPKDVEEFKELLQAQGQE